MAHIPYGYRIENGQAVLEPEAAKKLNDFIDAYLGGLSIKEARKASGMEMTDSSILDYLRKGTYAGTDSGGAGPQDASGLLEHPRLRASRASPTPCPFMRNSRPHTPQTNAVGARRRLRRRSTI